MPLPIPSPKLRIQLEPLAPASFAPYGAVIENPTRFPQHVSTLESVSANQGSATKYLDVTYMTNFYDLAPSRQQAKAVMNMFVCKPRTLRDNPTKPASASAAISNNTSSNTSKSNLKTQLFDVKILERHPYTTQTFIPLGLTPTKTHHTQYLVIVAPTLPLSATRQSSSLPFPEASPKPPRRSVFSLFSRSHSPPCTLSNNSPNTSAPGPPTSPKGSSLPDLSRTKAFLARGNQAVTYAAGTWHAPMVVLGMEAVDFVVVQFANGVALEDCQEVTLETGGGVEARGREEGIAVEVEVGDDGFTLAERDRFVVKARL